MKYTREQLQRFVDEIRENGTNVSKWEADYVDSVADQLERTGRLSDRQVEILDRIYAERTP